MMTSSTTTSSSPPQRGNYLLFTPYGSDRQFWSFWRPEFDSIARLTGDIDARVYNNYHNNNYGNDDDDDDDEANAAPATPFFTFESSTRMARAVAQRMTQCKEVYELWAHAATLDELVVLVGACMDDPRRVQQLHGGNDAASGFTFSVAVDSFGRKLSSALKNELREALAVTDPPALRWLLDERRYRVQLRDPMHTFHIIADFGTGSSSGTGSVPVPLSSSSSNATATLREVMSTCMRVYFVREFAGGRASRCDMLNKYELARRAYIGPTSTKAELALLMANQGLVKRGSVVYDPFCGTGSILVAAAHMGATVVGNDFDTRVLHGIQKGKSIGVTMRDSFAQYGLPRPDVINGDSSLRMWRRGCRFDAILCDPPYGIRESAKQSGASESRELRVNRRKQHRHDTGRAIDDEKKAAMEYFPPSRVYPSRDMVRDMIVMAARHLVMGGRLVFLLPGLNEWTRDDMPRHECMRFVALSRQVLMGYKGVLRLCVTMEKVRELDDLTCTSPGTIEWPVRIGGNVMDAGDDPVGRLKELVMSPPVPAYGDDDDDDDDDNAVAAAATASTTAKGRRRREKKKAKTKDV